MIQLATTDRREEYREVDVHELDLAKMDDDEVISG